MVLEATGIARSLEVKGRREIGQEVEVDDGSRVILFFFFENRK